MKTNPKKLILFGTALVLVVLLGLSLMRPGKNSKDEFSFPSSAGVIVVAAIGAVWLKKKHHLKSDNAEEKMLYCLDKITIGPGKVVAIVEAQGERLLLSSAEHGIALIKVLGEIGNENEIDGGQS
jgi:hypothetical protein